MNENDKPGPTPENLETFIQRIQAKIENLKIQYNLFFTGEIRIPPEKEREELEKQIRSIVYTGQKNPRLSLLLQNLTSSFTLYNNMWLKKLSEIESGITTIQRKKTVMYEDLGQSKKKPEKEKKEPEPEKKEPKKEKEEHLLEISLNSEDSFDNFFKKYNELHPEELEESAHKEKIVNTLKAKLITKNLIDAKISIQRVGKKVKVSIKKDKK